jgi:4-amino-4-deoxy-L-arabinose transferase-like glycosyltransferase
MKKWSIPFSSAIILVFLVVLTVIPRLYRISNPIADWHSWRQADTASVTRNFVKNGFSPLFPKNDSYYALNGENSFNPNRYFFAEFPLYNIITYPLYAAFGVDTRIARGVSVAISALTVLALYALVLQILDKKHAITAGLLFALLPYNIYYGRVIMPDPLHVFFSVLMFALLVFAFKKNSLILTALAGMIYLGALLTKPYALVLLLPIAVLFLQELRQKPMLSLIKQAAVFFLCAFPLFLAWRLHIQNYPEGMFGTEWLFNAGNIRFTGAFFRWILFDRMNRLIFATGGFVLFWIGVLAVRTKREGFFTLAWLTSILVFFTIIAKGNVTHDYYQLPIVPVGVILIAKGIWFLFDKAKTTFDKLLTAGVVGALLLLTLAFGWYEVRGYFNVNRWEIVHAGQAVDRLLPQDAKVIAPYQNDPAFLYQTNRYGWPIGGGLVQRFVSEGATHYVSVDFDDDTNKLMSICPVVEKTPEYVILDLQPCSERILHP